MEGREAKGQGKKRGGSKGCNDGKRWDSWRRVVGWARLELFWGKGWQAAAASRNVLMLEASTGGEIVGGRWLECSDSAHRQTQLHEKTNPLFKLTIKDFCRSGGRAETTMQHQMVFKQNRPTWKTVANASAASERPDARPHQQEVKGMCQRLDSVDYRIRNQLER